MAAFNDNDILVPHNSLCGMIKTIITSEQFKWNPENPLCAVLFSKYFSVQSMFITKPLDVKLSFEKPPGNMSNVHNWVDIGLDVLVALYAFEFFLTPLEFETKWKDLVTSFPDNITLRDVLGEDYPVMMITPQLLYSIVKGVFFVHTASPQNFLDMFLPTNTQIYALLDRLSKDETKFRYDVEDFAIINDRYYLVPNIHDIVEGLIHGWITKVKQNLDINKDQFI